MAVACDVVSPWLALRWIHDSESMVTATIPAIIPCVVLPGVTNHIAPSRLARQAGRLRKVMTICLTAWLWIGLADARAQDKAKEPPTPGWSNSTDLSLVLTAGNSATRTWGFSDQLRRVWKDARFESEVNVVRSNTSDDRFFMVAPGIEFPVGGAPANPATSLIKPDPTLDVATYLVRGSYERNISPRFFWNAGGSWDRNEDAGILNRYITYAGVGNKWFDYERRRFATSYGISYTDREEEKPDPEKDRRFAGARLGWDYMERFNAGTTFDNRFEANVNLSDSADPRSAPPAR